MSPSLRIQDVAKRYTTGNETHIAIGQVTLSLPFGQIIAFLGPNGVGKTTLLRIILGLLEPDEGKIQIERQMHVIAKLGQPPKNPVGNAFSLALGKL